MGSNKIIAPKTIKDNSTIDITVLPEKGNSINIKNGIGKTIAKSKLIFIARDSFSLIDTKANHIKKANSKTENIIFIIIIMPK